MEYIMKWLDFNVTLLELLGSDFHFKLAYFTMIELLRQWMNITFVQAKVVNFGILI